MQQLRDISCREEEEATNGTNEERSDEVSAARKNSSNDGVQGIDVD